jgi:dTDP-4-dehydrorhamnose 3,5-epimerase
MIKKTTSIDGAYVLVPEVFYDDRGFFLESWSYASLDQQEIPAKFVQANHSRSAHMVLRGLHYQAGADAQGKLVWVTAGEVFDVVVDLRKNSKTFGKVEAFMLTTENHWRLWVPPGCAHGFLTVSKRADVSYLVTAPYRPKAERTLRWDDAELNIVWPIKEGAQPILSHKDANGLGFAECEKYD